MTGGHSNLTFLIAGSNGMQVVIRRPPLGNLIVKAHDMRREWSLISALASTNIPVPAALAFCDDRDVADSSFYVMAHVDGHSLASAKDTARHVPKSFRRPLALNFIDVLAELHCIEPSEIGLSGLGKPYDYISRQIVAWYRSWITSASAANYDDPRFHDLRLLMLDRIPVENTPRIVHGDFGLHNCLVGRHGQINAVLDWEISTIGEPLADLSYALIQFADRNQRSFANKALATAMPGFPCRQELAERYQAKTGIDLSDLQFYVGFNFWRKAAIAHGVYARYNEEKKDASGINLDVFPVGISNWLSQAQAILENQNHQKVIE